MKNEPYTTLKKLYSLHTGEEIAEAIKQIRREIQAVEDQQLLRAQLTLIQGRIKDTE
jgi:hypothetical protein